MRKNVASQKIGAQLVSSSDGSAFTGTVTVYVTGDAGTQALGATGSGVCTHEGNGYHTYAPSQGETNYDLIAFTFTGTGAIPVTVQIYTRFDANVSHINTVAAATPGASGGLTICGSNAATTFASLTVTGELTISNGVVVTCSTSNKTAFSVTGNGTGHGFLATSGSGATGSGFRAVAASTNGTGFSGVGAGTGHGIEGVAGGGSGSSGLMCAANGSNTYGLAAFGFGGGYDFVATGGAGSVITYLTVTTNAMAWNTAWDTEVQSECTDALNAYDPPTRTEATADKDEILAALGSVASGTIGSTGNDSTHLHLTGQPFGDDELNNLLLVIRDVSASEYHVRWIEDWADTGDLATVATLPFTPQNATDTYRVLAIRRDVDTVKFGGTAGTFASGRPEVNMTHIAGSSVSTSTAQLGVNVVNFGGSAGTFSSGRPEVNASHISGSATAADNAEIVFATDFATNYSTSLDAWVVRVSSGTGTGQISLSSGLLAWNPAWDAEVQSECADALNAYDPPTRAELTTDINSVIATAPIIASGTIGATGNDTTHLHLTGLPFSDDEINDHLIVVFDVSTSEYHARWIDDWANTGDLATVGPLPFTPQNSTDTYRVFAFRRDTMRLSSTGLAAVTAWTVAITGNITGNLSGSVGSVTGNVGGNVVGSVASVTGNVGGNVVGSVASVTGNVGGNVTGSVGSVAAGGITASSIAADAIGASELAADAASEIATAVTTALGTGSGLTSLATAAALATVDSNVDDIKTVTDKLDDTLEDDGGTYRFTSNALEEAPTGGGPLTAADVWTYATRTLTAIDEDSTTLDLDATIRAAVGLASANLDTQLDAIPTANENAAALLTYTDGVETGFTLQGGLRIILSAVAGKSSGHATNSPIYRNVTDAKNRIVATTTTDGRTAVTLDAT